MGRSNIVKALLRLGFEFTKVAPGYSSINSKISFDN
jgi:hypothetical protein